MGATTTEETVVGEKPMKRTLISVTVVVVVAVSLFMVSKSLAKDAQHMFGGPDYGRDPPSKIVSLLANLSS